MSISFPIQGLMSRCAEVKWRKMERQELSRNADGKSFGRSLGPPLWSGEWVTAPMRNDVYAEFESKLNALDGIIGTFYGNDPRKAYPRVSGSSFTETSAEIYAIGGDNKSLRIEGYPAGFIISAGDYLAFTYGSSPTNTALHQVLETVVCDGSGISPFFEVRPHLRAGVVVGDPVTMKNPMAIFTLEPDSIEPSTNGVMHSSVTFRGVQLIL